MSVSIMASVTFSQFGDRSAGFHEAYRQVQKRNLIPNLSMHLKVPDFDT